VRVRLGAVIDIGKRDLHRRNDVEGVKDTSRRSPVKVCLFAQRMAFGSAYRF
jgi:hypothetical protein